MFRFEQPELLYFLALSPVPIIVSWWSGVLRRRNMRLFGQERHIARLLEGWQENHLRRRAVVWTAVFALLVVAWANPQWGTKREAVQTKGIEIFIALDLSQSMLAEDIAPSRLERARRFAADLALRLRGNKIGLILFAGNAYLQVPLTTDYAAVALFANSVSPENIPDQGTAIAAAIQVAKRYFSQSQQGGKALVVISDGEDHEAAVPEALEGLRDQGAVVFALGVGTAEGSFIPVQMDGQEDYKRDAQGAPVRSRLNAQMLRELAEKGGGRYFNLVSGNGAPMEQLLAQIDRIEKRGMEQRVFSEYESYFQPFLFMALCLLLFEWRRFSTITQ
jgi:Ca-activated chloride channel family protein